MATLLLLLALFALVCVAMHAEEFSELHVGSPGSGKSMAGALSVANETGASLLLDPHERSMAWTALTHAKGNVLYERLSDIQHTLGLGLMDFLRHPDAAARERWTETFTHILLLRSGRDDMANTPLQEEMLLSGLSLLAFQKNPVSPLLLPFAYQPGTPEFSALVEGCTASDIKQKFLSLAKLTPKGLRSEVGSVSRLVNSVFRAAAFRARCGGGFNLGKFYQDSGRLIVERGDDISDDAMRTIMGSLILMTIEHAKRRPKPYPVIRIRIDEATNAKLASQHTMRGIAECRKYGLFFSFFVQNLNFPGGYEEVLQNCRVLHVYSCSNYDLARKMATAVAAGLTPADEQSRAELIAQLTNEILNLKPGTRYSRYPWGSRREPLELLENPWPDWPGLRDAKQREKIACIHRRPEYQTSETPSTGEGETPPSSTSPSATPSPEPSSPPSSPAEEWIAERKQASGSSGSGGVES